MNSEQLQKWALIAEIAGGIAIFVSLMFLVSEVNQNTRAIKAQTAQSAQQQLIDLSDFMFADPARREASRILNQSGWSELDPDQRDLANISTRRRMYVYDNAYYQYLQGTLEEAMFTRYRRSVEGLVRRSWFKEYWDGDSGVFSVPFVDYVNSLIEQQTVTN